MQNNRQYLIVGSFVLAGMALIVAILLWFSAASRKDYDIYRITFHEPIDGVTTSSVVKYNGVEVGKVNSIELDNQDPHNIYVTIAVNQGLNITTATYATIKPQGVTGMSYVALNLTKATHFTVIDPSPKPPYTEIPSQASFLYSISEQAQSVTGNIQDISKQVKTLLNDKNLSHVDNIINNLDKMTSALAGQSKSVGDVISQVGSVLNNVNQNTQHLNDAIIQLAALSKALQQNSVNLDKVLTVVQNNTLRNVNTVLLPELNQSVNNMNGAMVEFNDLMKMINQNPSALVRGKTALVPGPGE